MVNLFLRLFPILFLCTCQISAQDIYNAAYFGNYEAVKQLLETNPGLINKENDNGRYVLEMAAQTGQIKIVQLLIEKGADVNQQNSRGVAPLHMAAIYGSSTKLVQLLLDHGADINIKTSGGLTPLNYALFGRQKKIAEQLLKNGAQLTTENQNVESLIYIAASSGIKQIVDMLVTDGLNYDFTWEDGCTYLHAAAEGNLPEFAQQIISNGVDVNSKNRYGHSPLHFAALSGSINIIGLLLKNGADIENKTLNGRTPLNIAQENNNENVIQYFISKGAQADDYKFPEIADDYAGMKKPGDTPEIFAPDIISAPECFEHSAAVFSPNLKEVYWSAKPHNTISFKIYFMELKDGKWTQPGVAPFCDVFGAGDPVFSTDGRKIFYVSRKPYDSGMESIDQNIWVVEKTNGGWSNPAPLDSIINSDQAETIVSEVKDGAIYFLREGVIYKSKFVHGKYLMPEKQNGAVNSGPRIFAAFVPADESFMLIEMFGTEGYGGGDLFISYPADDGTWGELINLGDKINTASMERFPFVSADGKYLFFLRVSDSDDIYWVETDWFNGLKSAD